MSDFASPSTRIGTPLTPGLRSEVLMKEHARSVNNGTPDGVRSMHTPGAVDESTDASSESARTARKTLEFKVPAESSTVRMW